MRKSNFSLLGVLALTFTLVFTGCPDPTGGDTVKYTVTFDSNGGTDVSSQQVNSGGKATEPSPAPTKTGYTFGGWYKESAFTNRWNFTTDTVSSDITLYAKWAPVYTVTFEANGGTPAPQAQTVVPGGKVTPPSSVTKNGNVFDAWYKESTFNTLWDFAIDTVNSNTTLYAKWTEVNTGSFGVTFDTNGGVPVPQGQVVVSGNQATDPGTITKFGHDFAGWYSDAGLSTSWNFSTAVTENKTLYAKWTLSALVITGVSSELLQPVLAGWRVGILIVEPGTNLEDLFAAAAAGEEPPESFAAKADSDETVTASGGPAPYTVTASLFAAPDFKNEWTESGAYDVYLGIFDSDESATPTFYVAESISFSSGSASVSADDFEPVAITFEPEPQP